MTSRDAQAAADALVPRGHGWVWNQVLMDLGARVCRPSPACDRCPLMTSCAWMRAGRPEPDPAVGSAGVSTRQAPFDGSDRQARGRVLRALQDGPRPIAEFDQGIVATLVADGLVETNAGSVRLPE